MIHIVFQNNDVHALAKSFEIDTALEGTIMEIKDDYAVGPLGDAYSEKGISNRLQWWKDILKEGHYDGIADDGHVDDNKTVAELKLRLTQDQKEVVWIWAAQNKHDVSGYYWLIYQLKDFQGRAFILYLNNLPFINEKGSLFYPTNLFQIPPREFVKAKKLARPVTSSEFEIDADEWSRLCAEDKGVRLLEGGKKLVQRGYRHYDNELLNCIGKEWTKASRLLQQYYSKVKETTGDVFLLWRIKSLIEEGKVEMQGNIGNMKEFEVRQAGIETQDTVTMTEQTA